MPVDPLVVRQAATDDDARDDPRAIDGLHRELDQAIVEQQYRSRPDVADELLVIESHALGIALLAFRVEHEPLARRERDGAGRELADADLRALQVRHDADLAAERAGGLAHEAGALHVVGRAPVREIEADDVDAGGDQAGERVGRAAGGAERGDDLGGAGHGVLPSKTRRWYANSARDENKAGRRDSRDARERSIPARQKSWTTMPCTAPAGPTT